MILNIVTPCSRFENLNKIADSINIPRECYRWIVVFDSVDIPDIDLPPTGEYYTHTNHRSCAGHAQRNFANTLISDGYVLQLDDDTILHPDLWDSVKHCDHDLVSWRQMEKNGTHRLFEGQYMQNHIDSGSFMVKRDFIDNLLWDIEKYHADGIFAENIISKNPSILNIDKYLSYYNYLR